MLPIDAMNDEKYRNGVNAVTLSQCMLSEHAAAFDVHTANLGNVSVRQFCNRALLSSSLRSVLSFVSSVVAGCIPSQVVYAVVVAVAVVVATFHSIGAASSECLQDKMVDVTANWRTGNSKDNKPVTVSSFCGFQLSPITPPVAVSFDSACPDGAVVGDCISGVLLETLKSHTILDREVWNSILTWHGEPPEQVHCVESAGVTSTASDSLIIASLNVQEKPK